MARPLTEIDGEQVRKLAHLGCTQEEIGEFFGVNASQISRRFARDFELGKAECKTSLRRWQIKKARAGCTTMLIHLGKVYLGQTDRLDITSDSKPFGYIERAQNPRHAHLRQLEHANGSTNGHVDDKPTSETVGID